MRTLLLAVIAFIAAPIHAAELSTQDYLDIEQLYARYNHAIDNGDAEGWAVTFTPDGTFLRFTGRDALAGFVKHWRENMNGAQRRHWNSNLQITPTAEGAAGVVMLLLLDVSAKPASIASTGLYTDKLVKTAEGWRFKERSLQFDGAKP